MLKGLDHLAIVVANTEEALKVWRDKFGFPVLYSEAVNNNTILLTHLDLGNTQLQLVEPLVADHPLQAWLAANEIQDINRMIITSHNLGMTYAQMERYSSALTYLERSRQLAADGGNRHMIALNTKTIGGVLACRPSNQASTP